MHTSQKLKRARLQLILDHPFFASLALRMSYIEDPQIRTTVTNGKFIKYNPAFIHQLPIKQIAAVIAQDVLHVASLHHTRRDNRDRDCGTSLLIMQLTLC